MDLSEFLKQDFSESYNQLRHYDNSIFDSFKFIFTIYVGLIGGAISLLNLNLKYDLLFLSKTLIVISILFCFFVLFYIIELRIYFVKVARYINEIRHFYLTDNTIKFNNATKFYTDITKPNYFNLKSSHIILAFIVSALNAFSITLLLFVCNIKCIGSLIILAFVTLILQIGIITLILRKK